MKSQCSVPVLLLIFTTGLSGAARADRFTYVDDGGGTVELEARLAGSGQGAFALETADGQIRLVPQGAVKKRVPAAGPKPLTPEEMEAKLVKQFGTKQFRTLVQRPFVIGLVLSAPPKGRDDARCRAFLKRMGRFLKRVESVFASFSRTVKFPTEKPRYPLVVLVFETDDDFESYARQLTNSRTLAANRIAGFYSALTNWLAIRLSECHDFEVPLHEAIHQQVYNHGVVQRLAPVPKWFHEGIATGFEGNGDRISIGPNRISRNYARRTQRRSLINWETVVSNDRVFGGNVLAGEAYTHAWSLHWLLVTKYKDDYIDYVQMLRTKKPLAKASAEERSREFRQAFGKTPAELQREFATALQYGLKRQRISLKENKPVGVSRTQSNLADVEMTAVSRNGVLQVKGRMMNISPIRSMSYYITVETNAGTYADWLIPRLRTRGRLTLKPQLVRKLMKNGRGGPSTTFRVRVRAAIPESDTAKRWRQGQLPVPVFGG